MNIWLMVTDDIYELPIAIADTARELAEITGKNENCIKSQAVRFDKGEIKSSIYHRIKIKEK